MTDFGITGFGAYIPRLRLERASIATAHRWMAPALKGLAKGYRAFCSWDEDAITMAVEAARDCLPIGRRQGLETVVLASTTLPYADLLNSGVVAGALGLPAEIRAQDATGSQRAGLSALAEALTAKRRALVAAADRPRARPASTQELTYGAGGAAFSVGSDDVVARMLGVAVETMPFVDHFRASASAHDYYWEERWIRDEGHAKLIPRAVGSALSRAGLGIGDIDVMVFASPLKGAAAAIARKLKFAGSVADGLEDGCGYAGAAHVLLMLANVLETAAPAQKILVIGFGQGAEAMILETTSIVGERLPRRGVRGSLAAAVSTVDYLRMASFYDEIALDWGMRGEKTGKAALTTQFRETDQLASFVAGRCQACGTVQFPQLAYCVNPDCVGPRAQFEDYALTDAPARVLTFTEDWLSYHPAPPLRVGFVQFDVGARLLMEIVDVGAEGIDVGCPLEMTFRIKEPDKVRGLNRYFWKAIPVASNEGQA